MLSELKILARKEASKDSVQDPRPNDRLHLGLVIGDILSKLLSKPLVALPASLLDDHKIDSEQFQPEFSTLFASSTDSQEAACEFRLLLSGLDNVVDKIDWISLIAAFLTDSETPIYPRSLYWPPNDKVDCSSEVKITFNFSPSQKSNPDVSLLARSKFRIYEFEGSEVRLLCLATVKTFTGQLPMFSNLLSDPAVLDNHPAHLFLELNSSPDSNFLSIPAQKVPPQLGYLSKDLIRCNSPIMARLAGRLFCGVYELSTDDHIQVKFRVRETMEDKGLDNKTEHAIEQSVKISLMLGQLLFSPTELLSLTSGSEIVCQLPNQIDAVLLVDGTAWANSTLRFEADGAMTIKISSLVSDQVFLN